jgi:predicted ester cyclase
VSLFRRKKQEKEGEIPLIVQLYFEQEDQPIEENRELVESHLRNLHMPGGLEEEKKKHDFTDFAMPRDYIEALDDLEFTIDEQFAARDQVTTRWTVQGIHRRPLLGLEPSADKITISGVTISVVKNERVRQEWAYWELPALTRRLTGELPTSVEPVPPAA